MKKRNSIYDMKEEFKAYRRELHRNPQTAFEEEYAAALVAEKLTEWGIPFKKSYGNTGIVATIEGIKTDSGKVIGLRADMDALDIQEEGDCRHASRIAGKMHACGHDGHTTTLLGAAKYLSENNHFNGKVHLIFQPGEETAGGAQRVIDEGLLNDFPCDYVFAYHNWPWLPVGKIATRPGALFAHVDSFEITVHGKSGHAALPSLVIDAIAISNQLSTALQTIVSRNVDPVDTAVLSIAGIKSDTFSYNVMPNAVKMTGTVRTFKDETRKLIQDRMAKICNHVADSFDAQIDLDYRELLDSCMNDETGHGMAVKAAEDIVGPENVDGYCDPDMGGEDFAAFLRKVPGAIVLIGQGVDDKPDSPHNENLHNSRYDFNDDVLPVGINYFVSLVENYLSGDK